LQTEEEEYPYSTLKGTLPEESMPGEAGASTVDTTAKGTELDETIAGEVKPLSDETTAKPTETDLTLPEEEEMTATGKFAEEEEISPVTK
jgi:hypothetical protein